MMVDTGYSPLVNLPTPVKKKIQKFFFKKQSRFGRMSPQRDGRTNEQTRKDEGAEGADQGEVSTIILGMLESSGFRKYSTLLVIQLFSRRLCVCHCLCIRLCLCICVPYSFFNSYYYKLSENVWVLGSVASRSGDVAIAGRPNKRTNKEGQSYSAMDHGRLTNSLTLLSLE